MGRATDRPDEPRPLGTGLDRLLSSLGAPSPAAVGDLFGRWDEVVGVRIAAHVRPLALRDGTLVVGVDDPAWATELRFQQGLLLDRLAATLGDGAPTDLEVRVRPGGG